MSQGPLLPLQPPQQVASLTASDLIPFSSRKVSLWRSRAFLPVVLLTGTCLYLFSLNSHLETTADIRIYMNVVAIFVLVVIFLIIYSYAGERKNALWYLVPAAITVAQMMFLLGPYIHFFREVLPGNADDATSFGAAFVASFIGAGLMEETLKAAPILLGLAVALYVRANPGSSNPVTRGLAVQGPLDGLMMGVAAGAAFILIETMLQYVPGEIAKYKSNPALGHLYGFTLLIPRIIKSIAGHMGYAAISGYFIGLAATHPRAAWKLVPIGIVISAVLHGFWNSSSYLSPEYGSYVAGSLISFMFLACLMKARQLEASRTGDGIDGRSILALSPGYGPGPVAAAGIVPPAVPGIAGTLAGAATAIERSIGLTARTTVPLAGAELQAQLPAENTAQVPASGLSIGTSSARYALAPNQAIAFSALFAADGVPPGFSGAIVGGPAGAMDIRNTGPATWVVTHADGTSIPIHTGQQFGAIAGTRLSLGSAVVDIASY